MNRAERAFVALGGNLGDRRAHLEGALAGLDAASGVRVVSASAAYENPAVGGPPQPDYWNAVAEVRTTLSPSALHALLRSLEDRAGRVRLEKDGPRTLDLDLLSFGDLRQQDPELTLPHPLATTRAFTVGPWAELSPDAVVPGTGKTTLFHAAHLRGRDPQAFAVLRRAALLGIPARSGRRPVVLPDREALDAFRAAIEGTLGFVPTMGALHAGHASLARRARATCDAAIASVFVNPLQFGPGEDFTRYPRTFEADLDLLGGVGVDAVYAPAPEDLFPPGFATQIDVGPVATGYEGAARPGHFRGVATIVAKLIARVRPSASWFGRKDAQQVAVVKRLATDLDLPGAIVVAPTVRDVDGLALSSRNRYLSPAERAVALRIPASLEKAVGAAAGGERSTAALVALVREGLEAGPGLTVSYVDVVDPSTFSTLKRLTEAPALMIVTAKAGTTRLLDNAWLQVPGEGLR